MVWLFLRICQESTFTFTALHLDNIMCNHSDENWWKNESNKLWADWKHRKRNDYQLPWKLNRFINRIKWQSQTNIFTVTKITHACHSVHGYTFIILSFLRGRNSSFLTVNLTHRISVIYRTSFFILITSLRIRHKTSCLDSQTDWLYWWNQRLQHNLWSGNDFMP